MEKYITVTLSTMKRKSHNYEHTPLEIYPLITHTKNHKNPFNPTFSEYFPPKKQTTKIFKNKQNCTKQTQILHRITHFPRENQTSY